MNIFDILGYRSDRPYSRTSKTSVGEFALVGGGTPPPPSTSKVYFGSTNITSIYYGSTPVTAVYFGSTKVFG